MPASTSWPAGPSWWSGRRRTCGGGRSRWTTGTPWPRRPRWPVACASRSCWSWHPAVPTCRAGWPRCTVGGGRPGPLAACSGVVPVVVVVTGPALSGPALLLGLADVVVMTGEAFAFVSGPAMVEEFTGIRIGVHQLGGLGHPRPVQRAVRRRGGLARAGARARGPPAEPAARPHRRAPPRCRDGGDVAGERAARR